MKTARKVQTDFEFDGAQVLADLVRGQRRDVGLLFLDGEVGLGLCELLCFVLLEQRQDLVVAQQRRTRVDDLRARERTGAGDGKRGPPWALGVVAGAYAAISGLNEEAIRVGIGRD